MKLFFVVLEERKCLLITFPLFLALAAQALAAGAELVFRKVSPSVVLIQDEEGFGSGVVIDASGLIVTNFHVVVSPLPKNVTAQVGGGSSLTTKTFKDIELVGVHPHYDLALIRINTGGLQLSVASLDRRSPVTTGESVYVIGNPEGVAGQSLRNSIADGIVSSALRKIEELDYIQTTAPINPGNSGGPLCDQAGRVVGIMTFKVDQGEGLGFAIPSGAWKRDDFSPIEKRRSNPQLSKKYSDAAALIFEKAQKHQGDRQKLEWALAAQVYRLALIEAPSQGALYFNIGLIHLNLKHYDPAIVYLKVAIKLQPDATEYYVTLGNIEIQRGNESAANDAWLEGVRNPGERNALSQCLENLAVLRDGQKQHDEAAYLMKWSCAVEDIPSRSEVRSSVYHLSLSHLDEHRRRHIEKKKTGFSLMDLANFHLGKMDESDMSPPDPPKASGPAVPVWTAARQQAIELPPSGLRIPLPAPPDEILPGRYGTLLLLHYRKEKRIVVADLVKGDISKSIRSLDEDAMIAAGGSDLYQYFPSLGIVEKWSLDSFEKVRARPLQPDGRLTHFEMGIESGNVAWAAISAAPAGKGRSTFGLLDLELTKVVPFSDQSQFARSLEDMGAWEIRVSARADIAVFRDSYSKKAKMVMASDASVKSYSLPKYFEGKISMDPEGLRMYCTNGEILRYDGELILQYPSSFLVPIHGSAQYIRLRDTNGLCELRVMDEVTNKILKSKQVVLPLWANRQDGATSVDRRFFASWHTDRLAVVGDSEMLLLPLYLQKL